MKRYIYPGLIYGLGNPVIVPANIPVGLPQVPPASLKAKPGTWYIDLLNHNAYLKNLKGEWIDLAGGPGSGFFTSLTVTSGDMTIVQGDLQIVQGNLVVDGDISAPDSTLSGGPLHVLTTTNATDLVAGTTIKLDTGGFFNDFARMPLITDSSGEVINYDTLTYPRDGSTIIGGDPIGTAFTRITSNDGSITFTFGANSIDMVVTNPAITTEIDGDTGVATESSGIIEIVGGANMVTAGISNILSTAVESNINLVGSLSANEIVSGSSITSGAQLTATTGDFSLLDGNLILPVTDVIATEGYLAITTLRLFGILPLNNLFISFNGGNGTLTGLRNIGIGYYSGSPTLGSLTTGSDNIVLGAGLLGLTTGERNILLGVGLGTLTAGSNNVAIGPTVATTTTAWDNNVVIKTDVADFQADLSDSIIIGGIKETGIVHENVIAITHPQNTGAPISFEDDTIYIGGNNASQPYLRNFWAGIYNTNIGGTNAAVLVDDDNQLGTISSSIRYKDNVQDMVGLSSPIMELKPVTFSYKCDRTNRRQFGLIAEQVNEVFPYLVNYNDEGQCETVRYHELPVMILNEAKKLSARIDILVAKLQPS